MRDTALYQQVLGLTTPWSVSGVELDVEERRVDIWVGHPQRVKWPCPQCGGDSAGLACRDHAEERIWRHLDTCQFQTYLHARIPRVDCPEHGVLNVAVPWAERCSRFTLLMESLIIDVLRACATVTGACDLLRISWDEAFGAMQSGEIAKALREEVTDPRVQLVTLTDVDVAPDLSHAVEQFFQEGANVAVRRLPFTPSQR